MYSKNRQFLTNKSPYLRNGARWEHKSRHNDGLIGSRIRDFGGHCTLSTTKMQANDSGFWKYKVYADSRGGSS